MVKLLIADRDRNELAGISWLVKSYALPFDEVLLADSMSDLFRVIEAKLPGVICVELDMIQPGEWEGFMGLVTRYSAVVIVMTAEATYERAYQGIQLGALDLWLKPLTPEIVKRVLARSVKLPAPPEESGPAGTKPISYHSLFNSREKETGCYQILLIKLENPEKKEMLHSFVENYSFPSPPVILPLNDVVVCLFSFLKKDAKRSLLLCGNRFLKDWENRFSETISLVIYNGEKNLSLQEQYEIARGALDYQFYQGSRKLFYVTQGPEWKREDPFLTPSEQRLWIAMLNEDKRQEIKEWMYGEFLNQKEPYPEPGFTRIRLTSILAQVSRFMKTCLADGGENLESYHKVFHIILYNPNLYRIVQEFYLFILDVLDLANSQKERSRRDIVELAYQYIESHFQNPHLKLEHVSSHVERSQAYLSSQFSKRYGIPFRDALNYARVKEAKRLLRETLLPIQHIASKSGFDNANYFSRIFKKSVGLTPREYRNQKKMLKT
ncbi:helix-turn-helix domain-containing protein [Peribacillus kribbensis]|uniref:helix-turn-helix domain-containing protein n=1 Tax=Peribacillus kribbensis TaxID=356658 RepID=UPI00055659A9|nr:helix-turn-helix domain-containing protein [Peribacillus kribbensis]